VNSSARLPIRRKPDSPRDYAEIVARLQALNGPELHVTQVAKVWGYPWFQVDRSGCGPAVLLTGGMHGEEPAGVEGVLRWLEGGEWRRWPVSWLVLPCINPYGWERNYRRNRQRRDINRQFRRHTDTPETNLIRRLVQGRRFIFSIEFHEDVDAAGYYLYEGRRQLPYLGERILRAVTRTIHINPDPIIDGNAATGEGLIRRRLDEVAMRRRPQWPMAYHLLRHCTDHILGSETPVTVPVEQRARAHVVALRAALKLNPLLRSSAA
jgi:murein peptide amidase A